MEKRLFGKTGLNVSAVGFGGIPIQRVTQEKVNEIIDAMIENGVNFIDTARAYTVSEGYLGNALKGKRDKFYLATKSPAKTYEDMKSDIEKSLSELQTDYIELYQCHLVKSVDEYNIIMGENGAYKALLEAKEQGKIGHIGITAHSADFLMEVVDDMPFETIQFPYNLVETQAEELFERAKKRDIGVIVMKPIAGGAIDRGDISIKFILSNKNVDVVIPGMEKIEEVEKNTSIANGDYALTAEEQEYVDTLRNELGDTFCRRCGYCLPCPVGIDIPVQFIVNGYLTRYNIEDWARQRYESAPKKASDCVECGKCEPKCPYNLPIRKMLKEVAANFEK